MYSMSMYRNLLKRYRSKNNYTPFLKKNDEIIKEQQKPQKKINKPINFKNGDHLNPGFHFLLQKEYDIRKNSDDLPPFLL